MYIPPHRLHFCISPQPPTSLFFRKNSPACISKPLLCQESSWSHRKKWDQTCKTPGISRWIRLKPGSTSLGAHHGRIPRKTLWSHQECGDGEVELKFPPIPAFQGKLGEALCFLLEPSPHLPGFLGKHSQDEQSPAPVLAFPSVHEQFQGFMAPSWSLPWSSIIPGNGALMDSSWEVGH